MTAQNADRFECDACGHEWTVAQHSALHRRRPSGA